MLSNEEQVVHQAHWRSWPRVPSSALKVFPLERGQQLHLTFAGNASIAEDSLNHPLIMLTLDALVCGRRQRFCADEIFLKPTTERFLHIEQVPYILLNRPFPSRLWINCSCESP